jgi:hypothetical protein
MTKLSSLLAASLFALPLAAQAAPAAGAPPANPVTTAFRVRTMALQKNLAQAFDSIPERLFSYKPTPAQLTVGYVAQHLASDNYFFCNNFGAQKATVSAEETSTPDSVKAGWPRAKLVANMKASFDFCEAAFAQLDDAKLGEQFALTMNGNTRQLARANMVLGHVIDIADHYSQIANYMRLNNLIPPSALPRPAR